MTCKMDSENIIYPLGKVNHKCKTKNTSQLKNLYICYPFYIKNTFSEEIPTSFPFCICFWWRTIKGTSWEALKIVAKVMCLSSLLHPLWYSRIRPKSVTKAIFDDITSFRALKNLPYNMMTNMTLFKGISKSDNTVFAPFVHVKNACTICEIMQILIIFLMVCLSVCAAGAISLCQ